MRGKFISHGIFCLFDVCFHVFVSGKSGAGREGDAVGIGGEVFVDGLAGGGSGALRPDVPPVVFYYFGLFFGVCGGYVCDFGSEGGE